MCLGRLDNCSVFVKGKFDPQLVVNSTGFVLPFLLHSVSALVTIMHPITVIDVCGCAGFPLACDCAARVSPCSSVGEPPHSQARVVGDIGSAAP